MKVHRGVILWLNGYDGYGRDRYAGRVGGHFAVYQPFGDEDDHDNFFEVEVVAEQRNLVGMKPTWDWDPYFGWPTRDTTIINLTTLLAGAAAYKREFYDWPRLNLASLRALVVRRRAAPPGYLLIKGAFVKPRRTSRATTTVDVGVVAKLCDGVTLPDVAFEHVVSFCGNLEPHRPWRKPGPDGKRVKWGSWTTLT